MIRTLLVLEGRLVRGALAYVLSAQDDIEVIGELDEFTDIKSTVAVVRPDVTVVDLNILGIADLRVAGGNDRFGQSKILTLVEPRRATQVAGAMARHDARFGFLGICSPPERVIDGIRRLALGQPVLDGELVVAALGAACPLTARESEVLRTVAEGWPVREIATKFGLSPGTVRNHLSRIVAKTGVRNRIQAVRKARESGWI
jgi:two-component system response regulator DesR